MADPNDPGLQAVVMSQARELDAMRAQQQRQTIDHAIGAAIDASGVPLASGAARQQLLELFRGDVGLVSHGNQLVPAGPGLQPVGDFVKARLAQPEYAHFVQGKPLRPGGGPGAPATGQPGRDRYGALLPAPGDPADGKSLGVAVVEHALAQRAAGGATADPATNMSVGFGLRAVR